MSGAGVLERYGGFETRDVDDLCSEISGRLTEHQLRPLAGVARFDAKMAVAPLGPVSLVFVQHRGAELRANLTDELSYYDVNLSYGGRNIVTSGDTSVVVDRRWAAILSPGMGADMHLGDEYRQLHLRIERAALERHLEGLLGHPVAGPVRFDLGMDLTISAASSWADALGTLVRDLDQAGGLATHPLAVANWTELLMTGLLVVQHHNYTELLAEPESRRSPRTLRRAVDFIDEHLDQPLGLAEIAAAAGVGARSLQREFRDCLGLSPRSYVQQRRLIKVHEELLDASPGAGATVLDIALRWGFTHASRFAATYRERYGVSPSATLRLE